MGEFFQIFVSSWNTEILIELNYWLTIGYIASSFYSFPIFLR